MTRRVAQLGMTAASLLLLALPACDGSAVAEVVDGGAVSPEAGPTGLDAAPGPQDELEDADRAGVCYDGLDNDSDGSFDCADPGCEPSRATLCCVGSGDAACCADTPAELVLTVPAECADGPVGACGTLGAGLTAFGAEPPVFEAGAMVPQGGAGQGGIAIGDAIDPRSGHLTVQGALVIPDTRCADCIDAAGVALVDRVPADGARASVRVGLLAIGARDEILVMIGDEVVDRADLPADASETTLVVGASPGGRLRYQLPGEDEVVVEGVPLPDTVVAVAFGRTENRPGGEGALSIRTATRSLQACDVPSALVRDAAPAFPSSTSGYDPGLSLGRPSVVRDDMGRTWVAVPVGGTIHVLQTNRSGELVGPESFADPGAPAIVPGEGVVRVSDPWLELDGDRFSLLYVEHDELGETTLRRALGGPGYGLTFTADVEPLAKASDLPRVARLGAPTRWTGPGGEPLIVAIEDDAGASRLVALDRPDGESWALRGGSVDAATLRAAGGDLFAFDRDVVADPAAVVANDQAGRPVIRLYYAGARGTRGAIGLLVSADGVVWRAVGEVLAPRQGTYDGLAATGPAPLVDTSGGLELFYRGSDGVEAVIARARAAGTVSE